MFMFYGLVLLRVCYDVSDFLLGLLFEILEFTGFMIPVKTIAFLSNINEEAAMNLQTLMMQILV